MLKLKEIRIKRRLTQQNMADLLSISKQAYGQIENERYKINIHMLAKLADILSCTTDELLGRSESHEVLKKNWNTYKQIINKKNQE